MSSLPGSTTPTAPEFRAQPFVCGYLGPDTAGLWARLQAVAPTPVVVAHQDRYAGLAHSRAAGIETVEAGWCWGRYIGRTKRPSNSREAADDLGLSGFWRTAQGAVLHVDGLGFQDLYARTVGDTVYFANRMAPLAMLPARVTMDRDAWLRVFVMLGFTESRTPFREIRRLEAGESLDCVRGVVERKVALPSWLTAGARSSSWDEVTDAILAAMPAQAPDGVDIPLSGGLDSRILLLASRRLGLGPIRTWSTPHELGWDDDVRMAQAVAETVGVPWTLIDYGVEDWRAARRPLARRLEHTTVLHTWFGPLAQAMHDRTGPLLDGLAGDVLMLTHDSLPAAGGADALSQVWHVLGSWRFGLMPRLRPELMDGVVAEFRDEWLATHRRWAGHPYGRSIVRLLTRTSHVIGPSPFRLLGPERQVITPFVDPLVVEAVLNSPPLPEGESDLRRVVLRNLDPRVAALPSTNDAQPQDGRSFTERGKGDPASLRDLVADIRSRPEVEDLFAPGVLARVDADGSADDPTVLALRTGAMMSSWLSDWSAHLAPAPGREHRDSVLVAPPQRATGSADAESESRTTLPIPPLKLSTLPYPHTPLAIAIARNGTALSREPALVEFARKNGFELAERDGACVVVDHRAAAGNGDDCLFTGIAFAEDGLVFGADDRPVPEELKEAYGEFSLIAFTGRGIELRTDYFGFGKWYYFIDDDHFIAATGYHLLLLLLAAVRAPLEMDIPRSLANLSDIGFGFTFGQIFTRQMDVRNTYVSLPIERLRFDPATHSLTREKLPLYGLVTNPEPWDEDAYEEAVRLGTEEIRSNLQAVLASDRFDRVVIDLSAGFDSRIVFAAMTTLPRRLRDKVSVCIHGSHLADELPIGHAVNNLYGYDVWNSAETDTSEIFSDDGELDLFNLSLDLGCYTNLEIIRKCDVDPRTIKIMGGGGDILFGFYRTHGAYASRLATLDDAALVEKIATDARHRLPRTSPSVTGAVRLLQDALDEFPDDLHLYRRLQLHYLLFRNNVHFTSFRYRSNALTLNVLHSAHALRAKWMYWSRFGRTEIPPEKVSIDFLNALNPLLAQLPLAAENDPYLPAREDLLQPTAIEVTPDPTIRPYTYVSRAPREKIYSVKAREWMRNLDHARELLDRIEQHHPDYAEVASMLRGLLTEHESEPAKPFPFKVVNKIHQVGHEISIVSRSQAPGIT